MGLVARIAAVHDLGDVWNYLGADGGGIKLASDRYVAFLLGERESPRPDQDGDLTRRSFVYEMAYAAWPDPRYVEAIRTNNRLSYQRQGIGPVVLLVGESLP